MSVFWIFCIVKSLQCCLLLAAILVYIYLATIIWKKMVYNSNLTLLLLFLPIPSIVGTSTYTLTDFTIIFGINSTISEKIIVIVQNMGMEGGVLNLPNLIVDRLAATLCPAHYETRGDQIPWIAIAMITTQILLSSLLVALLEIKVVSTFVATMIFLAICIASAMLFSILPRLSRKLHDYHRKNQSSISIRYQSVENLKAAKLLKVLVAVYACFFLLETAIFYIFFFIFTEEEILSIFLKTIFNVVIIIEILTSIILIARSHPTLRRALPAFGRGREVQAAYADPYAAVRSYDGRPLSFSGIQQQRIYFEKLKEFWNGAKLADIT